MEKDTGLPVFGVIQIAARINDDQRVAATVGAKGPAILVIIFKRHDDLARSIFERNGLALIGKLTIIDPADGYLGILLAKGDRVAHQKDQFTRSKGGLTGGESESNLLLSGRHSSTR